MSQDDVELALIKQTVDQMSLSLFGGPGREGWIDKIQKMHRENSERIEGVATRTGERLDKLEQRVTKGVWLILGVYVTWSFLTSGGIVSLEKVLAALGK